MPTRQAQPADITQLLLKTGSKRNAFGIFNLRAGVQSDNFGLSIFANNVFNKKYLNEVITAVEFGGSFITPGTRRMFGVEGSYKF